MSHRTPNHARRDISLALALATALLASPAATAIDFGDIIDIPPIKVPPTDLVNLHQLPGEIAQDLLEGVAEGLAQREIDVALVGGETFMVNDCLGLKTSVGEFTMKWDKPVFRIDASGVELEFKVNHISMYALKVKMKPRVPTWSNPNPCGWSGEFSVGGAASNVKFTARFTPRLRLDDCQMVSLGDFDVRLSIGGLNLQPLQNNLDSMAKNMIEDSVTYALDHALPALIGEALNGSILSRLCEGKVHLYQLYMAWLGAGVVLHSLPEEYIEKLQHLYPTVDLRTVRFGYSGRQEPGNATTDCNRTYFGDAGFVEDLRKGTLPPSEFNQWSWLIHELQHTEQCAELGGRDEFAKRWFKDLAISALVTNLNSAAYYRVLHDNMPLEEDAMERERTSAIVTGIVSQGAAAVAGAEVAVYPAGAAAGSAPPVAAAVSSPDGLAGSPEGEYFLVVAPGTYDVYVKAPAGSLQLAEEDLVVVRDSDGDDLTDLEDLSIEITTGPVPTPRPAGSFTRGDSNGGGAVDISDALYTLSWLYTGGEPAACPKAADVNDDGRVDIADPLALLGFLFLGSQEPPAPFRAPGGDPTPDDLPCAAATE